MKNKPTEMEHTCEWDSGDVGCPACIEETTQNILQVIDELDKGETWISKEELKSKIKEKQK